MAAATVTAREEEQAVRIHKALHPPVRCRVCGCTEDHPCNNPGGETCAFMGKENLCTSCATGVENYREWKRSAHRPNEAAFHREVLRQERASQAYRTMGP